jgi:hypothetical protein
MNAETRRRILLRRQEAERRRAAETVELVKTLEEYFPGGQLAGMQVWLGNERNTYTYRVRLRLLTGSGELNLAGQGASRHLATMRALKGPQEEDLPF